MAELRSRVFFITQDETHPTTDETLLSEEQIKRALAAHTVIKNWAYIRHDRDIKEDGTPVHPHWHVALSIFDRAFTVDEIAKWFGVAPQYIEVPKEKEEVPRGKGAFFYWCRYLTHSNDQSIADGKYQYPFDEVRANFDYAQMLADGQYKIPSKKSLLREKVRTGQISLTDLMVDDQDSYEEDRVGLTDARQIYLRSQPAPRTRLCFYITGKKGGSGKTKASESLARVLAGLVNPDLIDDPDDDKKYFVIQQKKVGFEDYDAQPVIIFDNYGHQSLIDLLGDRDEVFKLFNPHPKKNMKVHIKYASLYITSPFLIVNSSESYEDFLNGLADAYYDTYGRIVSGEDRSQSWRRFPIIFQISAQSIEELVNRGWIDYYKHGEAAFEEYSSYMKLSLDMNAWVIESVKNQENQKKADQAMFGSETLQLVNRFLSQGAEDESDDGSKMDSLIDQLNQEKQRAREEGQLAFQFSDSLEEES